MSTHRTTTLPHPSVRECTFRNGICEGRRSRGSVIRECRVDRTGLFALRLSLKTH